MENYLTVFILSKTIIYNPETRVHSHMSNQLKYQDSLELSCVLQKHYRLLSLKHRFN